MPPGQIAPVRRILPAAAGVAIAACVLAGSVPAAPILLGSPGAAGCTGTIAVMNRGPIGTDTISNLMRWADVAVERYNDRHGTAFTVVDSPAGVDPSLSVADAEELVTDPQVVGVVGPQTSAAVEAAGPVLDAGGLGYVSGTATRASLTDGSLGNFFRVIANDNRQGRVLGRFIARTLHARRAFVVDQAEPYGQGLAATIVATLDRLGVRSVRASAPLGTTDFGDVIDRIGPRVDVVVLPFILAEDAVRFISQLRASGRDPEIVGGDGLLVKAFTAKGAYVSGFVPRLSSTAEGRDAAALFRERYGSVNRTGAGAFVAAEVVATAAEASCVDGVASRAGTLAALPGVTIPDSLLGTPVAFTSRHEPVDPRIYLFRSTGKGFRQLR